MNVKFNYYFMKKRLYLLGLLLFLPRTCCPTRCTFFLTSHTGYKINHSLEEFADIFIIRTYFLQFHQK